MSNQISIARAVAEWADWNATTVLELEPNRLYPGTNVDRDWDNESVEFTFGDDGSVLTVSGPEVEVEDSTLGPGE